MHSSKVEPLTAVTNATTTWRISNKKDGGMLFA